MTEDIRSAIDTRSNKDLFSGTTVRRGVVKVVSDPSPKRLVVTPHLGVQLPEVSLQGGELYGFEATRLEVRTNEPLEIILKFEK